MNKHITRVDSNHCEPAGPSGLEVAVSLLRQGVSFRIVGTIYILPFLHFYTHQRV